MAHNQLVNSTINCYIVSITFCLFNNITLLLDCKRKAFLSVLKEIKKFKYLQGIIWLCFELNMGPYHSQNNALRKLSPTEIFVENSVIHKSQLGLT